MSVIREVYSAKNGNKEQYSVARPETIFEQVDAIMDAMFGPTAYSGVTKLNRAAEYCSDQSLIESTKDAAFCEGFARASLLLQRHADSLDAYLVESFIGGQQ